MTDTELLDWLEDQLGVGLISDDFGNWAVTSNGMQNIPDPIPERGRPGDICTSFMVAASEWRPSIREAILADITLIRKP